MKTSGTKTEKISLMASGLLTRVEDRLLGLLLRKTHAVFPALHVASPTGSHSSTKPEDTNATPAPTEPKGDATDA